MIIIIKTIIIMIIIIIIIIIIRTTTATTYNNNNNNWPICQGNNWHMQDKCAKIKKKSKKWSKDNIQKISFGH